jgi:large subunit ribosomal protein L19e
MNLSGQRRLASDVMKIGATRVKFNPERLEEVSEAITKDDIRGLVKSGAIEEKPITGISRGRFRAKKKQKLKGRRKGAGKRGGTAGARTPKKKKWMGKIRAIRDELKKMRDTKEINASEYRKLYIQAKGNLFLSRRHMREQIGRMKE